MWYMPWMGWWMVPSGILALIFLAALIALVIWGVRQATGHSTTGTMKALDIAKERYARGEISKEEFEQLKKDLS